MSDSRRVRDSLLIVVLVVLSLTPLMPATLALALDDMDGGSAKSDAVVEEAAPTTSDQTQIAYPSETDACIEPTPNLATGDMQVDEATDAYDANQPVDEAASSGEDAADFETPEMTDGLNDADAEEAKADAEADIQVVQEELESTLQTNDESPQQTVDPANESTITSSVVVTMAPDADSTAVADVAKASNESGAAIALYHAHSKANQRFRIERIPGNAFCRIINVNSGLALSVEGSALVNGARIVQRSYSGSNGQRWIVRLTNNGLYDIMATPGGAGSKRLFLGANKATGALLLLDRSSSTQTTWDLRDTRSLAEGTYRIDSLMSGRISLNLNRGSLNNGANIEAFASNQSNAQRFVIKYNDQSGYYTIANTVSGLALDVSKASTQKGANILQWAPKEAFNQQWSIEPTDESGSYRIVSASSGLVLDVAGGKPKSGANVCQWTYKASKNQQWTFEEVDPIAEGCYTISAFRSRDYSLDVNRGSSDPFTNVQLWKTNSSVAQKFELLKYSSQFYTIRSLASGLYVSVMRSSSIPNANVDVEGGVSMEDGRLWEVLPTCGGTVLRCATGLAIDVRRGAMASGTNIIAYTPNGGANQRFVLKSIANDPIGVTQIAAEFHSGKDGSSHRLESLLVEETPCVYLPQDAVESRFGLRFLPTREDVPTQIALAEDAEYVALSQGDEIDLKLLSKQSDGSYLAWIRTSGANDARMLRFVVSKNHSSVDSAIQHVYSHRGASYERYEHTFEAYDLAIAQGSKQIEQDVVVSADGTLYVSHDASITLSDGTTVSFDSSADSEIDEWKRQDGNHVLQFADVIARYGNSVTYVVELKQAKGVAEAFEVLLQGLDDSYCVVVQSASPDVLSMFHGIRSGVTTLLLVQSQAALDDACSLSHVDTVSAYKRLMTEANVKKVHESGKLFNAWTLDTMPEIEGAIRLGVDSYFTDCTAKAISLELAYRA